MGALRLTHIQSNPGGDRITYLDGWRALAIAGVFVGHFLSPAYINTGRLGVELFFVLSGRLMAEILFVKGANLPQFYYRRITRVWPTVAIFLMILSSVFIAMNSTEFRIFKFVSGLTYTYNYLAATGHGSEWMDHLWSLCVEEHTYLFLGLLAFVSRKAPSLLWPVLVLTILFNMLDGVVCTYVLHQNYVQAYWRTDTRMASILLGVAAYLARDKAWLAVKGLWPLAFGVAGIVLNMDAVPDPVKYSLGTSCLSICVANLEEADAPFRSVLSHPALTWIGLASFSLYVYQQPFAVMGWRRYWPSAAGWLPGVAILCGVASYYVAETPIRRWLNSHMPSTIR